MFCIHKNQIKTDINQESSLTAMESKIVFLGTAGEPLIYAKQIRSSAGIVLSHDNMQMIINPGPGILLRAKQCKINLRDTSAILVTKNDVLSANDLNAAIDAMTNGGIDKKGVILAHNDVYDGNALYAPAIHKKYLGYIEKTLVLKPKNKVAINQFDILPIKTDKPESIGFLLHTSDFHMSYISDSPFTKTLAHMHADSDMIIFQVQFQKKKDGETTIEDVFEFLSEIRPKLAVLTGFGMKLLESDLLTLARTIQKETGVQTVCATDGLTLNPVSTAPKQSKL
jgi:phosphoribosyl 1,2-cyclic phosphodiesterase